MRVIFSDMKRDLLLVASVTFLIAISALSVRFLSFEYDWNAEIVVRIYFLTMMLICGCLIGLLLPLGKPSNS